MKTFKSRLLATTITAGMAMVALPAVAQITPDAVQTTQADGSDATQGDVVVTGSRIARPEVDSPVPVTTVDRAQLLQRASPNVSDILNELPQVGIGQTRTNTNFLTSGTGVSTVNLRALGSNRTLVLVNGRRFVGGFGGDTAVDINNIPVDFLERVDNITGGSSAVYGSDAVAGVVNFVLRDRFEGLQIRAQGGTTEQGDNGRYFVSVTGGTKWGADDRGNAIVNFSYDRDEGLFSADRAISAQDCAGLICGPASYSSYAPQGQFQLIGANGGTRPVLAGGQSTFSYNPDGTLAVLPGYQSGVYGFNRNGVRRIAVPLERYLASGIFNYELSDKITAYSEVTYARTSSNASLEASALANTDIYSAGGIPITNAFIPTSVAAAIAAANSDGDPTNDVTSLGFRRRQNEVFDRSNRAQRDTWRAVVGVRGDLGSNVNYDVSYVYGHLNDFNASQDVDTARYRQSLDSIRVGAGNVVGVDIVCRDEAARANGCIPINLFGRGTADPRASSYVQAVVPKSEDITNEQHVVTGTLSSSSLFDLGAGGVGVAVGFEYRYESVVDDLDILTNTGGNSGNQIPDLTGSQDVREVFGEVNVPLLADRPFFEYLGVNGAARYSDYSTIGNVFSWNAGAEWEPVRGFRLRGRYAVANRAPNNSELFSAPSETFAGVTDPCDGITSTSTGATDAACRAIPAIAAFFNANPNGTFAYTLADTQGINGFVGGNRDLQEETAKTITAGFTFTPTFVPGLQFTADYFDIKIEDAISTLDRSDTVEKCLLTNDAVFCNNVLRFGATGYLQTVNAQLINIAGFQVRGIDATLRYGRPLGVAENDRLTLVANYTYLLDYKQQTDPATPEEEFAGTFGRGFSTHNLNARATYEVNGTGLSWQTTLLSGGPYLRNAFISNDPAVVALNDVDDYWLHNLQISQRIDDRFTFFFNVDNVFDTKPQYLPGTPYGTPTGLETSADFDVFGRRFTAGATFRF
ncbi:TonB-dependent receptor plug domain-containing protein [Sphingomonas corticis]|jgi:outer membrane receptor protein involved in Fe transport|uniref:TonB-dependent receptor n=1 Tax=Sphingomonas corticis TaxID=2722791 RepID=A0ABX1CQU9_9SPHN|nr:TonB-dependent receptor [Sphingomonas corticis]NJR78700.1 TonB-dependent receptor [Sphingomonas corticis]